MDELKPCPVPWCERVNKPEVYNPAPEGCCVACPDCGLETNAFATEAEAIAAWNTRPTHEPAPELVERVARALAEDFGLDFDEVCGVDADPDEGYCDSSTCVASGYEDHDADYARRVFLSQARAAIAAMGSPVDEIVAWLRTRAAPHTCTADMAIADQIEAKWGQK